MYLYCKYIQCNVHGRTIKVYAENNPDGEIHSIWYAHISPTFQKSKRSNYRKV